jgi:hypothetical protein
VDRQGRKALESRRRQRGRPLAPGAGRRP